MIDWLRWPARLALAVEGGARAWRVGVEAGPHGDGRGRCGVDLLLHRVVHPRKTKAVAAALPGSFTEVEIPIE